MTRRKPITAHEFMQELESDPEWVAKRDAREREHAKRDAMLAVDEADLVAELRDAGYEIDSVYDLVNNTPHPHLERRFLGAYPDAYPILVRHLDVSHHDRIREGIIRALTVKDGGVELERALLTHFSAEDDPNLRWVLANALRTAVPYHRRKKHPEIAEVLSGSTSGG